MQKKHNSELVQNARALRKEMTLEERILWYHYLRKHPAKFYRQRVFGNYIVDFLSCLFNKLSNTFSSFLKSLHLLFKNTLQFVFWTR